MKKYYAAILFLIGLAFFQYSCASKSPEAASVELQEGMTLVKGVELSDSDGEAGIQIFGDSQMKYNVFKLNEPERIMIDVIDAQLSPEAQTNLEGNSVVSRVNVQAVEDSLSKLVRVEVVLNQSSNYLASLDGDELSVRLIPTALSDDLPFNDSANSEADSPMADADTHSFELPALPEPELDLPAAPIAPSFDANSAVPELSEAPSLDLPELSGAEVSPQDQAELPSLEELTPPSEAPSATIEPLPAPVPVPLADEMAQAEEAPAATPAPEAKIEPLPLPTAPQLDAPQIEETKKAEKEEFPPVIVEPEGKPQVKKLETQEIPATEFTEGTSLLSGIGGKVYTGKRVSLEFEDARIQDVIRLIADVSKLNIILADDVKGSLTLKLVDVPWDQALDIILTSKGLDKVQHGNVLRVAPQESLKKEREIALANDKAAKQLEPLKLKLFNINYATAGDMSARIKALLSERGSVDQDERTNTLIVEDIAENLSRIENLIKVLDTQTPQVRIESRIVQANDRFTRSLGIQWGPSLRLDSSNAQSTGIQFPNNINILTADPNSVGFTGPTPSALSEFAVDALPASENTGGSIGFRLGSVDNVFNLDLRLSYAENEQMARVVSRPSITVLDNETARIIQGSRIPFLSSSSEGSNVQFQEAGIEISVSPQITNDGAVILQVQTRSNEPGGESVGGNPIINIREASTNMLVKSGRTAVLGGVFKTSETKGQGGVPGLMDIPILGWLFKGESKSTAREEMLIFITPYILSDTRSAQVSPSSSSQSDPF